MDIIAKYIYVLNISQLKEICENYDIEYNIYIELENGSIKKTSEILHKEFIINNILNKLEHNRCNKVIYSSKIQNYEKTDNLDINSYIYCGQYNTTDNNIKKILKMLTDDKFYFGAISQKIIKKYWMENKLITYKQFAKLWLNEYKLGEINYDELAYNKFMKKHGSKDKWLKYKSKVLIFFENNYLL